MNGGSVRPSDQGAGGSRGVRALEVRGFARRREESPFLPGSLRESGEAIPTGCLSLSKAGLFGRFSCEDLVSTP